MKYNCLYKKLFFLAVFLSSVCSASVKVVTSTTDLAWLVHQIGGDGVSVHSLLKGHENPHFVDAVPEFIRQVSNADVVCSVGLDLEVGWMPKVLSRSSNAKVQPGGKGFCETGPAVDILERPNTGVDRSMGDVHPSGNPHFWLSPKHLSQAAKKVAGILTAADPTKAQAFMEGTQKVEKHLTEVHTANKKRFDTELKGKLPLVLEFHREFTYFFNAYGIQSFGSIEEKPGVAPSAGRLAEVALAAKSAGVKLVIASPGSSKTHLERFTELSGIPHVVVPLSLQPNQGLKEYQELQTKLVDAVIKLAAK